MKSITSPYRKAGGGPINTPKERGIQQMDSVVDSIVLLAAIVCSFGAAFLFQKIVLGLIMSTMTRR